MQIKFKYILITVAVLLFFAGGTIWYISHLNDIIRDRENTILVQRQNEAALKDFITMQADSLQDFAIFVTDLQKDNVDTKKRYNLLRSKYTILIDSVKVLNEHANVDTSNNIIKVEFDGKRGKVSYQGYTQYFKLTGEGTYTITIGVDSSKIESEIYLDIENNLIKNRIYIDGALITDAKTEIDSSLYIAIQGNKLVCPDEPGFFDRLHLLFDVNQSIKRDGVIWTPDKFSMGAGAEFQFNQFRIYGKYDYINSEVNAGIQYHPSIKDIWKAIF